MNTLSKTKCVLLASTLSISLISCGGSEGRQAKYLQRAQDKFAEQDYDAAKLEAKNVLQINGKNAEAKLLMGKVLLEEGEYRRAYAFLYDAAQDNPNLIDANAELAMLFFSASDNKQAKEYADKALALDKDNMQALTALAGVALRSNELDKAESLALQVIGNHPAHAPAVAILVTIQAKESIPKALETVNKALSSAPKDKQLLTLKSSILMDMGDTAGVQKVYREIVDAHPDDLNAYYQLARSYYVQDDIDQAQSILGEAIEKNPSEIDAKIKLIEFLSHKQGFDQAIAAVDGYIEKEPDNYMLKEMLSELYLASDQPDKAKDVLQKTIQKDSSSNDALAARNKLVEIALVKNERKEAERYIKEVLEIEPANSGALISKARINMFDSDFKSAIANLRGALKNDPESKSALKLLAFAQERDNAPQLALENYRRIIELDSSNTDANYNAGRLSLMLDQKNTGAEFLERAISINPVHVESVRLLSRVYASQSKWSEAEAIINPLIQQETTQAPGYFLRAIIYQAQGKVDQALTLFTKAHELDPQLSEPVVGIVETRLMQKDADSAEKFLLDYIEQFPDKAYAKDMLAQVYLKTNRQNDAIKIYKDIIGENPESEASYIKLGGIYSKQDHKKEMEDTYQKGLKNNDGSTALRLLLAEYYQQTGAAEDARKLYEEVLESNSENVVARNNLAVVLVNYFPSESSYSKALQLASTFSDSQNPILLDTLGWVHYHMNNLPQSISYLRSAAANGKSPEIHYHLGMAYSKSGDQERAIEQLKMATNDKGAVYFGVEEARDTLKSLPNT